MCDCSDCVPREEFEEVVGELRAEIERLKDEKADKERVDDLERKQQEDNAHHAAERAELNQRVSDLESEGMVEPGESNPSDPPIYDIVSTKDHVLDPTPRRTKWLFKDLSDYTRKTQKGRVIKSSELQRVLQSAETQYAENHGKKPAKIESKLAERVMDLAKRLTRDVAEIEMRNGEWTLIIPHDWKEQARERYQPDQARQEGDAAPSDTAVSA